MRRPLILLLASWGWVAGAALPDQPQIYHATNGLYNLRRDMNAAGIRLPWPGFDIWYQYGSNWDWPSLSNYMTMATNYGLMQNGGYCHVYLTDGWQVPWTNRVNGRILADPNWHVPLGLTNTCKVAHNIGFQMGLWYEVGNGTNSAAQLDVNRTNIAMAVQQAYEAGFDFIRVDITGGNSASNLNYMLDELGCWRKEMDRYPKPMWLMSSVWNEQLFPGTISLQFATKLMNLVNVVQFTQDASPDNTNIIGNWTNIMARFHTTAKYAPLVRSGHFLRNDHPMINLTNTDAVYPNMGRQNMALDAMLACVITPKYAFIDAFRAAAITNADIMAIDMDPLCIAARCVSTNWFAEAWERPLTGGRRAICIFNSSTATSTNITFQFQWVGWPTNTACTVRDVIYGIDWAGATTNGITVTIPPLCLSNYILTPVLNY